tara:strand:+ start:3432 stop:3824 length:393 start_codon:yes stop_codon:yes gene_type:complete
MSSGLTPKIPLTRDGLTGYELVTTYKELVKQNFRNLMYTIPGERVMDANFGVGLMRYLFEMDSPGLYGRISARIRSQIQRYLPYVQVVNITFDAGVSDMYMDRSSLSVGVEYVIAPLAVTDNISLSISTD